MVHKLNQTSQKILREAQSGKIFLLDGATGTFLQNNGLEAGGSPELMNIENQSLFYPQKMGTTHISLQDTQSSLLEDESIKKEQFKNIFSIIKRQDILLHHPYNLFSSSIEEFINQNI